MMHFVILQHQTAAGTHWDLMFEDGDSLLTYSLPPQQLDGGSGSCGFCGICDSFQAAAKILPPHRKKYLDYEGEISNNRGKVKRLEAGTFDKINENCYNLYGGVMTGTLTVEYGSAENTVILCYERKNNERKKNNERF